MNAELSEYLLDLDKYIVKDGEVLKTYSLDIQFPMNFQISLSTPDDIDQNLLVDIKESNKKSLKISLHHQDNGTQNGLLRIDYNARHLNPVDILPTLPEKFRPFAGQWLDDYSGHIHYVINGYKPLVWAIPLENDDFPIKKLNNREDYTNTLKAFFNRINLKTDISINHQMSIL